MVWLPPPVIELEADVCEEDVLVPPVIELEADVCEEDVLVPLPFNIDGAK
jgi:hypothetical protein